MRSSAGSKSPYLPISEKGLSPWQRNTKDRGIGGNKSGTLKMRQYKFKYEQDCLFFSSA